MRPDEQERLKGVTFRLTDKFESKRIRNKTFTINGMTYGRSLVELTAVGVRGSVLHEVGHIIQNNAIANAENLFDRTQYKFDLEVARSALNRAGRLVYTVPPDHPNIGQQLKAVVDAADAFQSSTDENRASLRQVLEEADMLLPVLTQDPATKNLADQIDRLHVYVAALLTYSDEKEKAVVPYKRLDEFVAIVKKHRLARRSAIFTEYAESNWPDKPGEFFAEAYEAWRNSPATVKKISPDLAAWFEKGGHLGPKIPPPRAAVKIPIPTGVPSIHKEAPVIEELLVEAGQTFLPAIEGGANIVDMILPLPLPRE